MENQQQENIYTTGQILAFDKPLRWTSFDLVKKVKNLIRNHYGLKKIKVGHAGTLDPLATGLLIICTGKATKQISQIQDTKKEYVATFSLGKTTPSYDLETEFDAEFPTNHITREEIEKVIPLFLGEQDQVAPVFSAKNIKGKRAYEYARKGEAVEIKPSRITIHEIEIGEFSLPELTLRIKCSKGTYIRSLASDFGKALKSGAHLSKLVRTQVGEYQLNDALSLDLFEKSLKKSEQI